MKRLQTDKASAAERASLRGAARRRFCCVQRNLQMDQERFDIKGPNIALHALAFYNMLVQDGLEMPEG